MLTWGAGFTEDDVDGRTTDVLLRRTASVREDAGGDCDGWPAEWIHQATYRLLGQEHRSAQQHGKYERVSSYVNGLRA